MKTERSPEVDAFLTARQDIEAQAVSACDGWTAHEVTAHLVGVVVEVTAHLQPYLAGEPVPETRSFEEREAAWRAMADDDLCRSIGVEEGTMRSVLDQVLERDPRAVIRWTGRQMEVAKFRPHLRSEFAIHRWDIVGDDPTSLELLGQPDLTEHAVGVLGEILTRRGRARDPAPDRDLHVRLRSGSNPDVRLTVEGGRARLELAEPGGEEPGVDLDPPARLLTIWGRRPDRRGRVRSGLEPAVLERLQVLLAGY
jgi:Mycothiol maleylpyruvate isomerase N-terminal domain